MENADFSSRIPVKFRIDNEITLEGELRTVLAPRTVERIIANIPISSRIHLWQKEIYFEIGIKMGAEKSKTQCKAGEIAYWPQGDAICIFFEEMTPFSKVNPIGQLTLSNFEPIFRKFRSGMIIQMHQE